MNESRCNKLVKSGQIGYHIFKYLVCPFFLFLGLLTLVSLTGDRISGITGRSFFAYLEGASIVTLLFWLPIFGLISLFAVLNFGVRWASQKDKKSKKTSLFRISIGTRIYLKKYLLMLSVGMFLVFIALYIHSYNYPKGNIELSISEYPIFLISSLSSFIFLSAYLGIYTQEERATYFLDRFIRRIGLSDNSNRRFVSSKDFETAISAYQKSMVTSSYCIKDLKEIRKRIDLVIDRGSPEDLVKLQLYLRSLSDFIKIQEVNSFDITLSEMDKFLNEKEWEKIGIIKIKRSDRELFTGSFKKGVSENMGKTILTLGVIFLLFILWILFKFPLPSVP